MGIFVFLLEIFFRGDIKLEFFLKREKIFMRSIWPTVKTAIKSRIPDHSYRMWIESLGFVEERDAGVVISCPNTFFQKKIPSLSPEKTFFSLMGKMNKRERGK